MKNKIVVIGTKPPCPRCKILDNIVQDKAGKMGLDFEFKHIVFNDSEAKEIGRQNGLVPGTAKHVAEKIGQEIDFEKISEIVEKENQISDEYTPYNDCYWSFELDEALRFFEKKAKEVGIMMTPVLVINGAIKHQGSVPELKQIEQWLSELLIK